jgi:hypothetical protein
MLFRRPTTNFIPGIGSTRPCEIIVVLGQNRAALGEHPAHSEQALFLCFHMKIKSISRSFSDLTVVAECENDRKLMADLYSLLSRTFAKWHRVQIRTSLGTLKAAYRRGDINFEQISAVITVPNSKQKNISPRPIGPQSGQKSGNSLAARPE